jgi:hypothetical protein
VRAALTSELARADAVLAPADGWSSNWLWSLRLIVATVLARCCDLIEIREHVVDRLSAAIGVAPLAGRSVQ